MANGKKQINDLVSNYQKMEANLMNLFAKPPLAVEAAMTAVEDGVNGAAISLVLDTISFGICSVIPVLKPFKVSSRRQIIRARDMGVLIGVDAGITHVMKKFQGKIDSQTRMVAGFGAGIMFSIVSRDPPEFVIMSGVIFALAEAAFFKVRKRSLE